MILLGLMLIILFGLLNNGILNKIKNSLAGRKGPPITQPYSDMVKHFRKGSVFSVTTTWITQVTPALNLACLATALCFIPFSTHGALISFKGDIFVFAYVVALGRFFMMLAA